MAQALENAGFDSLTVHDPDFCPKKRLEPFLEPLSVISYLAGVTDRIRLGNDDSNDSFEEPSMDGKTSGDDLSIIRG